MAPLIWLIMTLFIGLTQQQNQSVGTEDVNCMRIMVASLSRRLDSLTEQIHTERQEAQTEISQLKQQLTEQIHGREETRAEINQLKQQLNHVTEILQQERKEQNIQTPTITHSPEDCCTTPAPASSDWVSGGHRVQRTYDEILNKVIETNSRTVLYSGITWTHRMSIVNELLWVPLRNNNTIVVLSPHSSHKIREIPLTNIRPYSLYQTGDNEVVLASREGLLCLNLQGVIQYNITGGVIYDLSVEGETLVGYDYHNNSVAVVKLRSGKWQIQKSFTASQSDSSSGNTIHLNDNIVYVSSWTPDTIETYSLTGQYMNSFGSSGETGLPGVFYILRLCGTDSQGSVLICDGNNHRLQVLSPTGQWQVYEIQGMGSPKQVLIDKTGNMWVLHSDSGFKISKYSV